MKQWTCLQQKNLKVWHYIELPSGQNRPAGWVTDDGPKIKWFARDKSGVAESLAAAVVIVEALVK